MRAGLVVLGVAGLAGVGALAYAHTTTQDRKFQLINGKRYNIVHRISRAPGWDASYYPGFCNFSNPVITGQAGNFTEVAFQADWCAANMVWVVPQEIAISEA